MLNFPLPKPLHEYAWTLSFVCELSCFSHVQLFVTPWTVTQQAPLSMGFYRQEHWDGWPFPYPRDVPNPEIKPESPTSPALADDFFTSVAPLA